MIQVKPGAGEEGGPSKSFFKYHHGGPNHLLTSLRENLYNNTCLKGIPPLRSASPEDTTLFIGFNK